MKIADAAELHTTWAARFNAKDLDGMVALAETDSVFVPQPGVVVAGEAAVRGAEQQFLDIGLPITLKVRRGRDSKCHQLADLPQPQHRAGDRDTE